MTIVPLHPPSRRASPLRERLIELRDEMLDRMRRRGQVEPGHLPMLAGIEAALKILECDAEGPAPQGRATALLAGASVLLDVTDAAVVLPPLAAIRLAGELLEAAGLGLADDLARLRRSGGA